MGVGGRFDLSRILMITSYDFVLTVSSMSVHVDVNHLGAFAHI